jgi:type IV secretion system protein VirB10
MSTVTDENMVPDASPNNVSPGVRRANNLPVYLFGAVVLIFLIIMMLVAADRANQQNKQDDTQKDKGGSSSMYANKIAGSYTGLIPPAELIKAPAELVPPITIAQAENLNAPPKPPQTSGEKQLSKSEEEADRIRQMKMQQFQEAVKAHSSVQIQAPRSSGSAPVGMASYNGINQVASNTITQGNVDPTTAYKAKLAKIQNELGYGAGGPGTEESETHKVVNGIEQFGNNEKGDRWKLESKPEAPGSPYELRAGFVIPGTLISGINSELPGQIVAQVSQNVYDTPTGKYLLIPQGTRLVGAYSSDVSYGQARVLVAWQRLVFPDGKAMDIGAMPGADRAGYAGFNDQVNNHYVRLFGSAILMSAVTAGLSYSQRQNQSTLGFQQPNANSALSQALGQQLGQVTAQMISKNLSISPTLEIRPGFRFNVIVTKDLTLSKPYQAFDY